MKKIINIKFGLMCLSGCVAALFISGCASGPAKVEYSPIVGGTLSPTNVRNVGVYQTKAPERPYVELGVLEYRAGTAENYSEVVSHFREKAASIGADGIIMMGSSSGPSVPVAGVIANLNDYRAMAIQFDGN